MTDEADWKEHRMFILTELRSLRSELATVNANIGAMRDKDLSQIRVDIAMLQVKAGLFGAVAGAIIAAIPIILKMLSQ